MADDLSYDAQREVYLFFKGLLNRISEPRYFEHLRGYVSEAPEIVKDYVYRRLKGQNLLQFFRLRSKYFLIENDCVSLRGSSYSESAVPRNIRDGNCPSIRRIKSRSESGNDKSSSPDSLRTEEWKSEYEVETMNYFRTILKGRAEAISVLFEGNLPKRVKRYLYCCCGNDCKEFFRRFPDIFCIEDDDVYLRNAPSENSSAPSIETTANDIDESADYVYSVEFFAKILLSNGKSLKLNLLEKYFSEAPSRVHSFVRDKFGFKSFFESAPLIFMRLKSEKMALSRNYEKILKEGKRIVEQARTNSLPPSRVPLLFRIQFLFRNRTSPVSIASEPSRKQFLEILLQVSHAKFSCESKCEFLKCVFRVELFCLGYFDRKDEARRVRDMQYSAVSRVFATRVDLSSFKTLPLVDLETDFRQSHLSRLFGEVIGGDVRNFLEQHPAFEIETSNVTLADDWKNELSRLEGADEDILEVFSNSNFRCLCQESFAFLFEIWAELKRASGSKLNKFVKVIERFPKFSEMMNFGENECLFNLKEFIDMSKIFNFSNSNSMMLLPSDDMRDFLQLWLRKASSSMKHPDTSYNFWRSNLNLLLLSKCTSLNCWLCGKNSNTFQRESDYDVSKVCDFKEDVQYFAVVDILPIHFWTKIIKSNLDCKFIMSTFKKNGFALKNGKICIRSDSRKAAKSLFERSVLSGQDCSTDANKINKRKSNAHFVSKNDRFNFTLMRGNIAMRSDLADNIAQATYHNVLLDSGIPICDLKFKFYRLVFIVELFCLTHVEWCDTFFRMQVPRVVSFFSDILNSSPTKSRTLKSLQGTIGNNQEVCLFMNMFFKGKSMLDFFAQRPEFEIRHPLIMLSSKREVPGASTDVASGNGIADFFETQDFKIVCHESFQFLLHACSLVMKVRVTKLQRLSGMLQEFPKFSDMMKYYLQNQTNANLKLFLQISGMFVMSDNGKVSFESQNVGLAFIAFLEILCSSDPCAEKGSKDVQSLWLNNFNRMPSKCDCGTKTTEKEYGSTMLERIARIITSGSTLYYYDVVDTFPKHFFNKISDSSTIIDTLLQYTAIVLRDGKITFISKVRPSDSFVPKKDMPTRSGSDDLGENSNSSKHNEDKICARTKNTAISPQQRLLKISDGSEIGNHNVLPSSANPTTPALNPAQSVIQKNNQVTDIPDTNRSDLKNELCDIKREGEHHRNVFYEERPGPSNKGEDSSVNENLPPVEYTLEKETIHMQEADQNGAELSLSNTPSHQVDLKESDLMKSDCNSVFPWNLFSSVENIIRSDLSEDGNGSSFSTSDINTSSWSESSNEIIAPDSVKDLKGMESVRDDLSTFTNPPFCNKNVITDWSSAAKSSDGSAAVDTLVEVTTSNANKAQSFPDGDWQQLDDLDANSISEDQICRTAMQLSKENKKIKGNGLTVRIHEASGTAHVIDEPDVAYGVSFSPRVASSPRESCGSESFYSCNENSSFCSAPSEDPLEDAFEEERCGGFDVSEKCFLNREYLSLLQCSESSDELEGAELDESDTNALRDDSLETTHAPPLPAKSMGLDESVTNALQDDRLETTHAPPLRAECTELDGSVTNALRDDSLGTTHAPPLPATGPVGADSEMYFHEGKRNVLDKPSEGMKYPLLSERENERCFSDDASTNEHKSVSQTPCDETLVDSCVGAKNDACETESLFPKSASETLQNAESMAGGFSTESNVSESLDSDLYHSPQNECNASKTLQNAESMAGGLSTESNVSATLDGDLSHSPQNERMFVASSDIVTLVEKTSSRVCNDASVILDDILEKIKLKAELLVESLFCKMYFNARPNVELIGSAYLPKSVLYFCKEIHNTTPVIKYFSDSIDNKLLRNSPHTNCTPSVECLSDSPVKTYPEHTDDISNFEENICVFSDHLQPQMGEACLVTNCLDNSNNNFNADEEIRCVVTDNLLLTTEIGSEPECIEHSNNTSIVFEESDCLVNDVLEPPITSICPKSPEYSNGTCNCNEDEGCVSSHNLQSAANEVCTSPEFSNHSNDTLNAIADDKNSFKPLTPEICTASEFSNYKNANFTVCEDSKCISENLQSCTSEVCSPSEISNCNDTLNAVEDDESIVDWNLQPLSSEVCAASEFFNYSNDTLNAVEDDESVVSDDLERLTPEICTASEFSNHSNATFTACEDNKCISDNLQPVTSEVCSASEISNSNDTLNGVQNDKSIINCNLSPLTSKIYTAPEFSNHNNNALNAIEDDKCVVSNYLQPVTPEVCTATEFSNHSHANFSSGTQGDKGAANGILQPLTAEIVLLTSDSCIAVSEVNSRRQSIYFLKCCFLCDGENCCSECFNSLQVGDKLSCFVPPAEMSRKVWIAVIVSKEHSNVHQEIAPFNEALQKFNLSRSMISESSSSKSLLESSPCSSGHFKTFSSDTVPTFESLLFKESATRTKSVNGKSESARHCTGNMSCSSETEVALHSNLMISKTEISQKDFVGPVSRNTQ